MVGWHMDLSSKESVISQLRAAGIWSKKKFGQHFLVDVGVLDSILEIANVTKDDTVVEIGPGMGVLSQELLARAGRVVAFEFDREMVTFLSVTLPGLEVVPGDVLDTAKVTVPTLGEYKIVANIPYQITTPLLRIFLEGGVKAPTSMTLLVQKEVGERLAAGPKQSGRSYLSVLCQYYADMKYVASVPATAFFPPPKVDSAVVHFDMASKGPVDSAKVKEYLRFVRMYFTQPRKQLRNVIAGIKGISAAEIDGIFSSMGVPPTVRAQELSNEQWQELYQKLS